MDQGCPDSNYRNQEDSRSPLDKDGLSIYVDYQDQVVYKYRDAINKCYIKVLVFKQDTRVLC